MRDLVEVARSMLDKEMERIPAHREADMGGSGSEQEINWGDVVDVVKEALNPDGLVQEAMTRIQLETADAASTPINSLSEYKDLMEKLEDVAEGVVRLLKQAHKEGILSRGAGSL